MLAHFNNELYESSRLIPNVASILSAHIKV